MYESDSFVGSFGKSFSHSFVYLVCASCVVCVCSVNFAYLCLSSKSYMDSFVDDIFWRGMIFVVV
jgi:hypothetical protein